MTPSAQLFVPGTVSDTYPLVMLHGSGGDEQTLLPLAAELAPGASTLSIRGTVEIDGGYAFFHRHPDRSIDEADLTARIPPLVKFIDTAKTDHQFGKRPILVGFSNGAIMAAALLMNHPTAFSGAILFRPLSPFARNQSARLDGMPVLIIDGEKDKRRAPGDGARLAERLVENGATVTHYVLPVGHPITPEDKRLARGWLSLRR